MNAERIVASDICAFAVQSGDFQPLDFGHLPPI
jgi:hypothetical protein